MDSEMMPVFPKVVRCSHCNGIFWVNDAKRIGTSDSFDDGADTIPEEWSEALPIIELDIDGYQDALIQGLGSTKEREKYIRIQLWWSLNDLVRYEDKQPKLFRLNEKLFQENLKLLVELLKDSESTEKIMKAEISRELGDFEKCLLHLTGIPEEHKVVCNNLRKFVQCKSQMVQQIMI